MKSERVNRGGSTPRQCGVAREVGVHERHLRPRRPARSQCWRDQALADAALASSDREDPPGPRRRAHGRFLLSPRGGRARSGGVGRRRHGGWVAAWEGRAPAAGDPRSGRPAAQGEARGLVHAPRGRDAFRRRFCEPARSAGHCTIARLPSEAAAPDGPAAPAELAQTNSATSWWGPRLELLLERRRGRVRVGQRGLGGPGLFGRARPGSRSKSAVSRGDAELSGPGGSARRQRGQRASALIGRLSLPLLTPCELDVP
jgi:hypothetical protein